MRSMTVSLSALLLGVGSVALAQTSTMPTGTPPARPEAPAQVMPPLQDVLNRASQALNEVRTAKGRFFQVGADGTVSTGEFALRRPGRMLFDYDDPVPLKVIADGSTVAIEDEALETVDRVPLGTTPLGLILGADTSLSRDARILNVYYPPGRVAIQMADASGEMDGDVTLFFHSVTYDLLEWHVRDIQNGLTQVRLADVETGISLNPRLFRIEDPEDEDDRRR